MSHWQMSARISLQYNENYTAIRSTRDNRRWILIGDDRNLSSRRQGLMRFKKSFFPYLKK